MFMSKHPSEELLKVPNHSLLRCEAVKYVVGSRLSTSNI